MTPYFLLTSEFVCLFYLLLQRTHWNQVGFQCKWRHSMPTFVRLKQRGWNLVTEQEFAHLSPFAEDNNTAEKAKCPHRLPAVIRTNRPRPREPSIRRETNPASFPPGCLVSWLTTESLLWCGSKSTGGVSGGTSLPSGIERKREHRGHSPLVCSVFFSSVFLCFVLVTNHMAAASTSLFSLAFLPGLGSEVAHVRKAERWSDGKPGDSQPAVGEQANCQELLPGKWHWPRPRHHQN